MTRILTVEICLPVVFQTDLRPVDVSWEGEVDATINEVDRCSRTPVLTEIGEQLGKWLDERRKLKRNVAGRGGTTLARWLI